jgi:phosphotransferase system HPr (HPr) family protein
MSASSDDTLVRRTVSLPAGVDLHARPAGLVVRAAAAQEARVTLRIDGRQADATSILQVLALGATRGTPVEVEASGPDASAALDAIAGLLETLD